MKHILTTDITTTAAAKIKKGTLAHLQNAHKEVLSEICKSLIGEAQYDVTKYYILYGCVNTGTYPNYIISEGAIFSGGEVYLSPSKSFTATGAKVAIFDIDTAYVSDSEHDPVAFSDGSSHNIHQDKTNDWNEATAAGSNGEFTNMVRLTNGIALGSFSPTANYTATIAGTCRKNREGLVKLKGYFTMGVGAAILQTITTLPVGYRPSNAVWQSMPIYLTGSSTYMNIVIVISTNGDIQITNFSGGGPYTNYILFFENFTPFYTN